MHDAGSSMFSRLVDGGHEQVHFCHDRRSGLRAIVAIHSSRLGPALGGCRMYPYQSEAHALQDVLRLAQGMTMKAAASGLALGGGKAVIVGDPSRDKSESLWRAFGRFVEGLGGRYITAEDVGTSLADLAIVRQHTRHAVGVPPAMGGSGDPSPVTAMGVLCGMRAAVEEAFGSPELANRHVAVQGCGHVGSHLVRLLCEAGARVTISDVSVAAVDALVRAHRVEVARPEAIDAIACDVFAPCAMGAALREETIPKLRCRVVAGAANNQLADEALDGERLAERGIVYAPDYVINAGGLINVYHELQGYQAERALAQTDKIYQTTKTILAHARKHRVTPAAAARALAQARLDAAVAEPAVCARSAEAPSALRRVG